MSGDTDIDTTGVEDTDRGTWLQTSSGGRFYPLDPRETEVELVDIAHGLANQCRFSGQTSLFWSVAQHSLVMSTLAEARYDREMARIALMHDAAEAYIGDMIRPLKVVMPEFCRIEARVWRAIARRFGLPGRLPPEIKQLDNIVLATEKAALMPRSEAWPGIPEPLDGGLGSLIYMPAICVIDAFMNRWVAIGGRH